MIFPDCRNDNAYNEDFLDKKDKTFVSGYDWATETIDNLFDNIEMLTKDSDIIEEFLGRELPDSLKDEYTMDYAFSDNNKKEERTVETYGDFIRMKLLEWLEMQRNELITSMIDGMSEKAYEEIKEAALKKNKEKPEEDRKEYYDTRKYMITGKKEE